MKVCINGDAFVITSSLSVEDIAFLAKVDPNKLKVREKANKDDEVGNEVFAISHNPNSPNICGFGITFGGSTRDGKGLATYTGQIPAGTEKAKDFVADKIGAVATYLPQLEASIPPAIKELKDARSQLLASIIEDGVASSESANNNVESEA